MFHYLQVILLLEQPKACSFQAIEPKGKRPNTEQIGHHRNNQDNQQYRNNIKTHSSF